MAPLRQLRETATRIAKVAQECKINTNVDEYTQSFKSDLIDVTYLVILT